MTIFRRIRDGQDMEQNGQEVRQQQVQAVAEAKIQHKTIPQLPIIILSEIGWEDVTQTSFIHRSL